MGLRITIDYIIKYVKDLTRLHKQLIYTIHFLKVHSYNTDVAVVGFQRPREVSWQVPVQQLYPVALQTSSANKIVSVH
jgi:hypothetical protein